MSSGPNTPTLGLHNWTGTDDVLRSEWNDNFTSIDNFAANLSVANTKGIDGAFGTRNYNAPIGVSQAKNLGGVMWQVNGVAQFNEGMYGNTDASGNITDLYTLWWSYFMNASIFQMDFRTGLLTGHFGNLLQAVSGGFKVQSVYSQSFTTPSTTGTQKIATVSFPTAYTAGAGAVNVVPGIVNGLGTAVSGISAANVTNTGFDLWATVAVANASFSVSYIATGP